MKKITFKKGLLIYIAVLIIIIAGLLLGLRGILVKYEKSQAYNLVESFIKDFQADLTFNSLESVESYIDYSKLSRFEDKDSVIRNYITMFGGKKLEYSKSSVSYDDNNPIYIIHSGDIVAGELKLKLVSEKIELDMLSIPTWAIASFTPELSAIGTSYAISAPEEYKVTVNGTLLGKDDVASREGSILLYMVKGLSLEPEISVQSGEDAVVPYTITKSETSDRLMMVKTEYVIMNFTVPASFKLESQKNTTVKKEGNLATYSAVFNAMPTSTEMNALFKITDAAGTELTFEDVDGIPTPKYYEYTLICADNISARIGSNILPRDNAEKLTFTDKQYSDANFLLKGSIYTVDTLRTADDDDPAVLFTLTDNNGTKVPYELSGGVITVSINDVTVTVPDNFSLKIDGAEPDIDPAVSDISEYAEIKDYVSVPKAHTYVLKGQCAPVKVSVIDNRGDSSDYYVTGKLTINEQTGTDTMPVSLQGSVDPLYYGKQYSLFLTDSASYRNKASNYREQCYAAVRKYILNNSYLDNNAKTWINSIDITFVGSVTYDNPPFSKESVSNYVAFSDSFFYCDVSFIKSFKISSGLHRDDAFSKRLYFMYTDDDNDGVKTWVIVHMTDIVS